MLLVELHAVEERGGALGRHEVTARARPGAGGSQRASSRSAAGRKRRVVAVTPMDMGMSLVIGGECALFMQNGGVFVPWLVWLSPPRVGGGEG